jgi:hypothetical protein
MIKLNLTIFFFQVLLSFSFQHLFASSSSTSLEIRALGGDINAQISLGHREFSRTPPKYLNALFWFEMSANNGHPDSCRWLGNFYKMGLGVPENEAMAIRWWMRGAHLGSVKCMEELFIYYLQIDDQHSAYAWLEFLLERQQDHAFVTKQHNRQDKIFLANIEKAKESIEALLKKNQEFTPLVPMGENSKFSILNLPNGDKYLGATVNGVPNGYGHRIRPSGGAFMGSFRDGKANGLGKMFDKQGKISHEGLWENGLPIH